MNDTRILVTGGTGCIGATTIHQLLAYDPAQILIASRSSDTRLLEIWSGSKLDNRIHFVSADIGNNDGMRTVLDDFRPTHIVHLGALQSPDCDARPLVGMEVNVGGTLNLFHAVRQLSLPLQRFVFASSAAVYGRRADYDMDAIPESARLAPPNLYGVWKVAGEHLAALFQQQTGIPTVCLRLNTTYGPGRDRGKTSAPTVVLKMLALAAHREQAATFAMPYQGRENYHYVEDVGAHFAAVTMKPFEGFGVFNIKGRTLPVERFLAVAAEVAAECGLGNGCQLTIAPDAPPNLFICDLKDSTIDKAFDDLPRTEIAEGIRNSLTMFTAMAQAGKLSVDT